MIEKKFIAAKSMGLAWSALEKSYMAPESPIVAFPIS
jgi:hypothetical protein